MDCWKIMKAFLTENRPPKKKIKPQISPERLLPFVAVVQLSSGFQLTIWRDMQTEQMRPCWLHPPPLGTESLWWMCAHGRWRAFHPHHPNSPVQHNVHLKQVKCLTVKFKLTTFKTYQLTTLDCTVRQNFPLWADVLLDMYCAKKQCSTGTAASSYKCFPASVHLKMRNYPCPSCTARILRNSCNFRYDVQLPVHVAVDKFTNDWLDIRMETKESNSTCIIVLTSSSLSNSIWRVSRNFFNVANVITLLLLIMWSFFTAILEAAIVSKCLFRVCFASDDSKSSEQFRVKSPESQLI